jgi:hypothetical protein
MVQGDKTIFSWSKSRWFEHKIMLDQFLKFEPINISSIWSFIEKRAYKINWPEINSKENKKSYYYHLAQRLLYFRDNSQEQVFQTNINYEKKEQSNLALPNIFLEK